ncbi:MAG: hypothetical protein EG823_08690 [Actinobacteria bacterium]|nr:hypothetical protein [Actinomycetota bacterium]
MRKVVVALVVAALALTLVGCGGKKEEEAATDAAATDTAAAAAPVAEEVPPTPDKSANDTDIAPAAFPSFTTTETPAVFQEKLDANRPMLILFYDDAQQVTPTLRQGVDAVANDYRGLVDYLTFSVGGAATDPATLAAVQYASELGVPSTPYIIVVDRDGFITWRCKGYVEKAVIQREVERASR